jgi:hypothetical protein
LYDKGTDRLGQRFDRERAVGGGRD